MDHEANDFEARRSSSFGHTSRASSLRRNSFNLSRTVPSGPSQVDNDIDSESVSEAGDIGDRALWSNRFSVENLNETASVAPIPEADLLQSYGFWSRDQTAASTVSHALPLPAEIGSAQYGDKKQESKKRLPRPLEYISCLIHLAVFGILGVLTRYLLEKLFGPGGIGATGDHNYMYLDLPSNVVGSFLMGWLGIVFKSDISQVSDFLAIGLTTGYLGSLTTFSGWNQKMLDLSVEGQWGFVFLGNLVGFFLAAHSIIVGVQSAEGFRWLLKKLNTSSKNGISNSKSNWKVDNCKRHLAVLGVLVLMLGLLWGVSGTMEKKEFSRGGSGAQLWLACMVGPVGVWIRWYLARLNGRSLGRAGLLKWVPFGTLIANVSAACIMAALATVKKAVKSQTCDTVVAGIQFGFLGCLSTVSTFMAEYYAMNQSDHPWRAYVYALVTIVISFCLGTLIYSVPVWVERYN